MAKSISTYRISILNWSEHNKKHKDSFKKTLIANNFCTDSSIQVLPLSVAWMYLGLILIAGNENQGTIKVTSRTIQELLRSKLRSEQALIVLQENQLLTFEEMPPLNRNEENRSKKKVKENNNIPKTENLNPESTQSAKAVAVVDIKKTIIRISNSKQIEIKTDLVQSWADTYPKDFLELSLKEMRNWILSSEHKAPKTQWARFMNGWFQRGWERYRQNLKSNPTKLTVEDLDEMLGVL